MEIITTILIAVVFWLYLKIRKIQQHLVVLSFSEKVIDKLLVKKNLIKPSEVDIATNETIGDMPEDEGNRIIKCAKNIGVVIPQYMDDEQLKKYVEQQESNRRNMQISFTDRVLMEESDLKA